MVDESLADDVAGSASAGYVSMVRNGVPQAVIFGEERRALAD